VKLLYPASDVTFFEENGVGLTPFDVGLLKMQKQFHGDRAPEQRYRHYFSDGKVEHNLEVYRHLQGTHGPQQRRLATSGLVNQATALTIEMAVLDAQKYATQEEFFQNENRNLVGVESANIVDDWWYMLNHEVQNHDDVENILHPMDVA